MSIPQILEVAVGLIVIYYLLGSVVSLITQWINETLESRGKALQQYLVKIVGDKKIEDLKNLPQIQALRPIRYKDFLSVFVAKTLWNNAELRSIAVAKADMVLAQEGKNANWMISLGTWRSLHQDRLAAD